MDLNKGSSVNKFAYTNIGKEKQEYRFNKNIDKLQLEIEHQKHVESGGYLGRFFGIDTNKSIIYSGICLCGACIIIRMISIFLYKFFWCQDLDVKFIDGFVMLVAGYIFGSSRKN